MINRRRSSFLLGTALLLPGGRPKCRGDTSLISRGQVAWRTATPCGANLGYDEFWNHNPVSWQRTAFAHYGISFVRGIYFAFFQGAWTPLQLDAAVQNVVQIEPVFGGSSNLILTCDGYTYAVPAGDTIVLSTAISCNGVMLPARTRLTVLASTAGNWEWNTNTWSSRSTITVAGAGTASGLSAHPVSGVRILHNNFYKSGTELRSAIKQYCRETVKYASVGLSVIYSGWHGNWHSLFALFGEGNVESMREQEWAHVASLNLPPSQALIADENEPVWPGAEAADRWAAWQPYFKRILFPKMRSYFPYHTLGFGTPAWCNPDDVGAMLWWPPDPNTLLRVHAYFGNGGRGFGGFDGSSRSAFDEYMNRIAATQARLNISDVLFEEFGTQANYADVSIRMQRLRRSIQAQGWKFSPWVTVGSPSLPLVSMRSDDTWYPTNVAPASFGLN